MSRITGRHGRVYGIHKSIGLIVPKAVAERVGLVRGQIVWVEAAAVGVIAVHLCDEHGRRISGKEVKRG